MRQTGSLSRPNQCSFANQNDWGKKKKKKQSVCPSACLWVHCVTGHAAGAATTPPPLGEWDTVPPFFPPRCLRSFAWENVDSVLCFSVGCSSDCRHRRRETGHRDVGDGLLSVRTLSRFQRATDFFFLLHKQQLHNLLRLNHAPSRSRVGCVQSTDHLNHLALKIIILFVCLFLKSWAK